MRAIDERFYELAAERLQLARQIGQVKKAAQLPIKDYQTEKEVLDRSRRKAEQYGLPVMMAEDLAGLLIRYAVLTQDECHREIDRSRCEVTQRVVIAGGRGRMGLWLSEFFESFGHEVVHVDPGGGQGAARYPVLTSLTKAAAKADIVVLSVPITATAALIRELADAGTTALVFDICSLKTPLIEAVAYAKAKGLKIGSVHPMFGPQVELLAAATSSCATTATQRP